MKRTGVAEWTAASLLMLALLWPAIDRLSDPVDTAREQRAAAEWPIVLDGETLRPLAPNRIEERFARRFPGAIGRFASADADWVLRRVETPTRMLHPATDCYRGLGYAVRDERLERVSGGLQRCFIATQGDIEQRICERIVDADGKTYTDTSAWYWDATLGRSRGPWLAATRAER